jgi:hypothetical protein
MNWTLSDRQLVELFRKWIIKRRENEPEAMRKARENRGAGGVQRQNETSLKALGVLRLLRAMHWTDAAAYAERILSTGPMYENQPAWIRAKSRAEREMSDFSKDSF